MYHEFYGLRQAPFKITPDTRLFFPGGNRGEILEALVYAISSGEGIVKVVGEVGSGKTMLCRMLEVRLPKQVEIVYLPNPSLTPEDILHNIALEMGIKIDPAANRIHVMQDLHHCLLERHANNRRVVVFVEEAQAMPLETLEEIRLLSNLETQQDKLLQIVLFGQPELDKNLNLRSIRQLRERITHSFGLPPLTAVDIQQYVRFRLSAVGYRGPDMFDLGAYKAIARASKGLTRRVNILADKSLLAAFAENTHNVSRTHALKAITDSEMKTGREYTKPALAAAASVAAVALVVWVVLSGMLSPAFNAISVAFEHDDSSDATNQVVAETREIEPEQQITEVASAAAPTSSTQTNAQSGVDASTAITLVESSVEPVAAVVEEQALMASAQAAETSFEMSVEVPAAEVTASMHSTVVTASMQSTVAAVAVADTTSSESTATIASVVEEPAKAEMVVLSVESTATAVVADTLELPSTAPEAQTTEVAASGEQSATVEVTITAAVVELTASDELMDEVAPAGDMTAAIAAQAVELATDTSTEVAESSSLRTTEETVIANASAPAPEEAETSTTVADETLPAGVELLQQRLLAARTWLSSTDRSYFTIQLLATDASQSASLEEFLRSWRAIGRLDRIYVYRTKIRGGVWFGVLYDDFKTFSAAREALDRLPPEIKRYKPFIRNVRDIGNLG